MEKSVDYTGALQISVYRESSLARGCQELLLEGTVRITIQPLNLIVVIPVKEVNTIYGLLGLFKFMCPPSLHLFIPKTFKP